MVKRKKITKYFLLLTVDIGCQAQNSLYTIPTIKNILLYKQTDQKERDNERKKDKINTNTQRARTKERKNEKTNERKKVGKKEEKD